MMTANPIKDRWRLRFYPSSFRQRWVFRLVGHRRTVALLFFTVVCDRNGLSWYGQPALKKHTGLSLGELDEVRRRLEAKDLIASRPPIVQVLSLPMHPVKEVGQTDTIHLFTDDTEPQDGDRL
jgi:hypothetical protein